MTNKKLNLANLKKEVKKLSSQTEHTLLVNGSEYKIKIDDKFLKTKQHQLLDDLVEFFNEANNKIELIDLATPYTSMLFIKHFTDVEVSNDIDDAIDTLQALINLDLLTKVLNLMPEDEVVEVYELLNVTVNRMRQNMEDTAEEAERLSETVENEELKVALLNGRDE